MSNILQQPPISTHLYANCSVLEIMRTREVPLPCNRDYQAELLKSTMISSRCLSNGASTNLVINSHLLGPFIKMLSQISLHNDPLRK